MQSAVSIEYPCVERYEKYEMAFEDDERVTANEARARCARGAVHALREGGAMPIKARGSHEETNAENGTGRAPDSINFARVLATRLIKAK